MRLEPRTPGLRVKHLTTEPRGSLQYYEQTKMENRPYPLYMIVNKFTTEQTSDNIWISNKRKRVPMTPISEPPKMDKQTTTPVKKK